MRILPEKIGIIHVVGIGGIGMSGIAEILDGLGYEVRGSNDQENRNTQRLSLKGIQVCVGHTPEQVHGAGVVVISSAIGKSNPELQEARRLKLPVVRRAEMLAELMRLKPSIVIGGAHGKTTTTTMTSALLDQAGDDPTVINGVINAYGTNARLGKGDWMVVEADESDGTFIRLPATIGVLTNIDREHLDFYGSYDTLKKAFETFLHNIPFYGLGIYCGDDQELSAIAKKVTQGRLISYGLIEKVDVRAANIRLEKGQQCLFDVIFSDRAQEILGVPQAIKDILLPMVGDYNVSNALAALIIGAERDLLDKALPQPFETFSGVGRRFTVTGKTAEGITIVDDYAHHPAEIRAVVQAARQSLESETKGRLTLVVQPHRYSRLESLFDEFSQCVRGADRVLVLPVYAAGESALPGVDHHALVTKIKQDYVISACAVEDFENAAETLRETAQSGDMILCVGAGDVTVLSHELPDRLSKIMKQAKSA